MLCKDNMASLFLFLFLLKGITKTTYHEMHECYVMQILKTTKKKQKKKKKKKPTKEEWSQKVLR